MGSVSAIKTPDMNIENSLYGKGFDLVAGIDEAGRGPLAGPVVAAAVILPKSKEYHWYSDINDSKLLNASQREKLYEQINRDALAVGIGISSSVVIDELGIIKATRLAMRSAVLSLEVKPDSLIIDYVRLPEVLLHQQSFVKGDRKSRSIACASIIAKVARDRIMLSLDEMFPQYELRKNKGYGTKKHLECLEEFGPSVIHRHSFKPIKCRYERLLL